MLCDRSGRVWHFRATPSRFRNSFFLVLMIDLHSLLFDNGHARKIILLPSTSNCSKTMQVCTPSELSVRWYEPSVDHTSFIPVFYWHLVQTYFVERVQHSERTADSSHNMNNVRVLYSGETHPHVTTITSYEYFLLGTVSHLTLARVRITTLRKSSGLPITYSGCSNQPLVSLEHKQKRNSIQSYRCCKNSSAYSKLFMQV